MITWHSWNVDNLRRADAELRPVILQITSEINRRCVDPRLTPDQQEAYTFEEIERNFLPVLVVAEERPDIDMIFGSGTYPCLVVITPHGRVLKTLEPEMEQDLYNPLLECRRTYINAGHTAGHAVVLPHYLFADLPAIPEDFAQKGIEQLFQDANRFVSTMPAMMDASDSTLYGQGDMLNFLVELGNARQDESISELAGTCLNVLTATLWDPELGGYFLAKEKEHIIGVKKLSDQLDILEALINFSEFDRAPAHQAITALRQSITANFYQENGLFAFYSTSDAIGLENNFRYLALLAKGIRNALIADLSVNDITPIAQTLANLQQANGTFPPLLHRSDSAPLLGVQSTAAIAFAEIATLCNDESWREKGLQALYPCFGSMWRTAGGCLGTTNTASEPLPPVCPLRENMLFAHACRLYRDGTMGENITTYRNQTLQIFMQNAFASFGAQRYCYGRELLFIGR
ncbi:DUF255 domain-containing protein [Chrysiogenes arsenatis]|uniref:DUF255 domain-containing protein n=1 Tax=Chrysiogenes arsenatis TaxID=309797 RepID=UPI00040B3F29|nr:DUF255 domain-containing protein [Chrysiogenes arsenatis]